MDPTAPDIHLGHTVVLCKLRQFQDLGHKAILIIGDYTARIGDPTGQNTTRPILTADEIKQNAQSYFDQAGKILDMSPKKVEVRYNSEWLADLRLADVIKLTASITVARMLERDTFEIRYKNGDPIGVHEFLYPLMQGYDSVRSKAMSNWAAPTRPTTTLSAATCSDKTGRNRRSSSPCRFWWV